MNGLIELSRWLIVLIPVGIVTYALYFLLTGGKIKRQVKKHTGESWKRSMGQPQNLTILYLAKGTKDLAYEYLGAFETLQKVDTHDTLAGAYAPKRYILRVVNTRGQSWYFLHAPHWQATIASDSCKSGRTIQIVDDVDVSTHFLVCGPGCEPNESVFAPLILEAVETSRCSFEHRLKHSTQLIASSLETASGEKPETLALILSDVINFARKQSTVYQGDAYPSIQEKEQSDSLVSS